MPCSSIFFSVFPNSSPLFLGSLSVAYFSSISNLVVLHLFSIVFHYQLILFPVLDPLTHLLFPDLCESHLLDFSVYATSPCVSWSASFFFFGGSISELVWLCWWAVFVAYALSIFSGGSTEA